MQKTVLLEVPETIYQQFQVMAHFGLSPCGRAMIDLLRLNSEWIRQARRIWLIAGIHPPLA